ncbi:MAG TPA: AMP-binding protein [Gemmataceae bacterium]|jgi:phenylacetate-CoA ligase
MPPATADPHDLATLQADRLRALFAALPGDPFYARKFAGISLSPLTTDPLRGYPDSPLTALPFTTKAELIADQQTHPPYGTVLTYPLDSYNRLHQTSGTTTGRPLCWLDTPESWQWVLDLWRQKFELMRFRPDDRLFFPFSFGPFLGFWGAFGAASQCGYLTLPGGGMSSAARLRFMLAHSATVVFCTPSYALHLAEVAGVEGIDLAASPVRMLVAAGEPGASIPATRERIEAAWGARLFDHYGLTEVGPTAVECLENPGGMHVMARDYVAEVIDPATGEPVTPGTPGELVVTNLGRVGSPLVRYRTGDIVRLDPEPCPCGRPWPRLAGGVLGRTDDMIHLRGNNLYPAALEAVVRRFPEVAEYRVTIDRTGPLAAVRIELEPAPAATGNHVADRVSRAIRDELFFRADVAEVAPGTLPRFELKAKRIVKKE